MKEQTDTYKILDSMLSVVSGGGELDVAKTRAQSRADGVSNP